MIHSPSAGAFPSLLKLFCRPAEQLFGIHPTLDVCCAWWLSAFFSFVCMSSSHFDVNIWVYPFLQREGCLMNLNLRMSKMWLCDWAERKSVGRSSRDSYPLDDAERCAGRGIQWSLIYPLCSVSLRSKWESSPTLSGEDRQISGNGCGKERKKGNSVCKKTCLCVFCSADKNLLTQSHCRSSRLFRKWDVSQLSSELT